MEAFFNDVNDWLSVGGDIDLARDVSGVPHDDIIASLRGHGVSHVLDVRIEHSDEDLWVANGLPWANYLHLPIVDSWNHEPAESWFVGIEDYVRLFHSVRSEGDRLYAHCHMGINRGPSAAMLALLTTDPTMDPFDAFLAVREARDIAGLVYAESVAIRHYRKTVFGDDARWDAIQGFTSRLNDYWSNEGYDKVHKGISYYRSVEGGTLIIPQEA